MKDIICPNCHTTFQVDESTYASILSQVRNKEFSDEVNSRLKEFEVQLKIRQEASLLRVTHEHEKCMAAKDNEILSLKNRISELVASMENYENRKASEISAIEAKNTKTMFDAIREKEIKISELKKTLSEKESEHKLRIIEAQNLKQAELQSKNQEIMELKASLTAEKLSAQNREGQLKEQHKIQLQDKQDEIDRLKDFRLKLSTKMVGETLEQHCSILFAQAKSFGQFSEGILIKDNTVVEGTKGDFIFRDYVDGQECVSIMFEMKNEADATATKHKNEDFFDKLDKDRNKKQCEYAVLVSMLEQGNELYDTGIVDVGYLYPKMLVIRPQFFLPVLRLISESARKSFLDKRDLMVELQTARNETKDFARFEEKINSFRTAFNNNVIAAHKKFTAATEGIDKTIEVLEKQIKALRDIKSNFEASEQKLLRANELAEEKLTVKKLTYNNPTVRKMIEDADK